MLFVGMFENCNYIVLIPNLWPPYLYNIGSILFEEPPLRFALSFSFKKKKKFTFLPKKILMNLQFTKIIITKQ